MGTRASILFSLSAVLAMAACQPVPPLTVPTGVPSATASTLPSAAPTVIPSVASSPSVQPTVAPTPSATPSPTPSALAKATIKGVVQDDNGMALVGLSVQVESVKTGQLLTQTVTEGAGAYTIPAVPLGDTWKVSVQGKGYGLRQGLVSIPNQADTAIAYTQNFIGQMALTLRPEVVAFEASPSATATSPLGELTFTFSAPMDKDSVTSAFCVQQDSTSTLQLPTGATLPAGSIPPFQANCLMNSGDFQVSWPSPSRAVFKPIKPWPTTPSGSGVRLRVLFQYNGQKIRDNTLTEARDTQPERDGLPAVGPFFITNRPVASASFQIANDPTTMRIVSATGGFTAGIGGVLKVVYSRTLRRELLNGLVLAGGASGNVSLAPAGVGSLTGAQAAANYEISVNGGAYQALNGLTGTKAEIDYTDPTLSTVQLVVPLQPAAIFQAGDSVAIRVKSPVLDCVGNVLGTGSAATAMTPVL